MAQSITDIENEILAEKANHPELTPLTQDSSTAIWRLWVFITATIIMYFEQLMDAFTALILSINAAKQYGTDQWWFNQVKAFQYGDELVFTNNVYQYAANDPTKQIVAFCAVTSTSIVQIKAAGIAAGQPIVLTDDQLNGLVSYCKKIRPAGIKFSVQSLSADLLQIFGNIYFDAAADPTVIKPAVYAAITNYLANLNVTTFNGTLFINSLIDAVQAVPGLVGNKIDLSSIAAKQGADAYAVFTSSYSPKSGYFEIDQAYPLSNGLTFIPV